MSKMDAPPPQDESGDTLGEALNQSDEVTLSPRLQELAQRLDAAVAAAQTRRDP